MLKDRRILFGVNLKSHTDLILDEIYGLQDLGFTCNRFDYGAKNDNNSKIGRFYIIILNTFKLIIKSYKFKPDFIYLNSRVEYVASLRDFITIFIFKTFYYRKIYFVIKSHGSDLEILINKHFLYSKIVIPYLKMHVDGWLFLSTEELKWILSNNAIQQKKLFLTKNIVRLEKFNPDPYFKSKLKIPDDYKIILFVGRLIKEKGIYFVLDAFSEINKNHKCTLIIVGDGEEFHNIKSKINLLNIQDNIIMTGWINEENVTYYTSNGDILLFPTFCSEGFSMALFNSIAAGLAVVTTPVRAAVDYLKEPDNCLWVEPESSKSIISAIDLLLINEELIHEMRNNNKVKAQLFTKRVVTLELSNILESISSN